MRLIDADELLAQMIGMNDGWFDPRPAYGHESLIKIQPTVDAAPVKHGRWIENEGFDGDCYYTCSVCHCDWTTIDGTPAQNNMRYCPECGAKMDLEEQDAKEET